MHEELLRNLIIALNINIFSKYKETELNWKQRSVPGFKSIRAVLFTDTNRD